MTNYYRVERIKIKQERARRMAMADFVNFCVNWVWIEDKINKCAIKFNPWPSQFSILPEIVQSFLLILLKTRQIGLTWIAAAYVLWMSLKHPMFLAVIISLNEDHSQEFLDRVKFIFKRLPPWMVPPIKKETTQNLIFNHQGMESSILSMPTIPTGAESKTPNLLIVDEAHTIRDVGTIYSASYPGIQQAHGQVIVIANSVKSSPGWPWVRDTYTKSMRGENDFKGIFLPWMAHPDRPVDFRERMAREGMDPLDVIQHYPETIEEALSTLGGSYFGDVLGRHNQTKLGIKGSLRRIKNDSLMFDDENGGILEIWEKPYYLQPDYNDLQWSNRYAMGSDVSEGLGESYSVSHVIDRLTDQVVARMRSNRVDAYTWAGMLYDLSQYYDNAMICPERTGAGQTTVKRLIELGANLYVRVKPDTTTGKMGKVFGWEETHQSKHELAGDLRQWLRSMQGILYDAILLDECSTFIKTEQGTLDHEEGKLSDCVISAGLAVQADKFLGPAPKKATLRPLNLPPSDLTQIASMELKKLKEDIQAEAEMAEEAWVQ